MRKASTFIGFSLGLIASIGIVLQDGAPRRVNYAFVGGDSQYSDFLGMPGQLATLVIGLPVLGAVLGLVVGVLITSARRRN
ncbi:MULTISPECIES: hypothetical protein [unclassified Rhodococcus (in: high G+C Gram-positive bacteria)]|uniref:hypothetical protein n=1 Tax=unclassified Rhodococcus (in: high G+C Gram-positive bacteria) TaxID=192944 RepID=UPI000B9BE70A|nr:MULTISPECIES: hypothetical protein [unclassified Rhodococcus (in: high G+C Gram-positive bacteria)]OZE42162.1 hypothetical protein CH259_01915 [Rhodococcus sp. 05-2254-4]OZE49908.1 hypothetical protein CH261_05405 [Rhodococcus sp. 05-2254-3]OZE50546.1 hypothetical protein CH283_12710 [Rhodococcus sp. 05-2254-2]